MKKKIPHSCQYIDKVIDFLTKVENGKKFTKNQYTKIFKDLEKIRSINESLRMQTYDAEEYIELIYEMKELLDDHGF